jgi:hypothetical protein
MNKVEHEDAIQRLNELKEALQQPAPTLQDLQRALQALVAEALAQRYRSIDNDGGDF